MSWRRYIAPTLACLTLGLARFVPEPHVIGKLRWVIGGAHGMRIVDWFDLLFHGAPWLWLAGTLVYDAVTLLRKRTGGGGGDGASSRGKWLLLGVAMLGAALCVAWSLAGAPTSS